MSNRMTDALARLAQRMPRVVREHEVLRVAGWIPGDEPAKAAEAAIREVLKWAQRRCGGQLPQEAWEHRSFEYLSGGRNSSCVHLVRDEIDIWAIRADDPDKEVPGRVWTTEVIIGLQANEPAKFSARLLVSTSEDDFDPVPHTPGFVQQVAHTCGLMTGGQQLRAEPMRFETAGDADKLIDHLVERNRRLPTIAISVSDESLTEHPTIDAVALSRALLGIGHVALVYPEATWGLTKRLGKLRSVFGGAARVYLPGFTDDADPYRHRLILADQLQAAEDAERATRWMRRLAARESIRHAKLGSDVLAFAQIRDADLQLQQETLREGDASETDQLAAAKERIAELENQIEGMRSEIDYYVEEYEEERERAQAAEAFAQGSSYRINYLIDIIKGSGEDPDADVTLPSSWEEFADWCDKTLAGRLVITSSARRGLRKPQFQNVELAARCLLWLANDCRYSRIDGSGASIRNISILAGVQNAPCGADEYEFGWGGRIFSADWHIKNGGNTRDPTRCLRIYYCFDQQTQLILISDMPAHRRTGAS